MLLPQSHWCCWRMSFLLLDSTLWRGCICCCCFKVGWIYAATLQSWQYLLLLVGHIMFLLLCVGDFIWCYYYDMDYVDIASWERACVLDFVVATYCLAALGVRELFFLLIEDVYCFSSVLLIGHSLCPRGVYCTSIFVLWRSIVIILILQSYISLFIIDIW